MEDEKAEASHPKGSTASQNNMGTLVRTAPPSEDGRQNRGFKETFQIHHSCEKASRGVGFCTDVSQVTRDG